MPAYRAAMAEISGLKCRLAHMLVLRPIRAIRYQASVMDGVIGKDLPAWRQGFNMD